MYCAVVIGAVARVGLAIRAGDGTLWADEKQYHAIASNLVNHGQYAMTLGQPTAYRPPGTLLLLVAVYAILGASIADARVVQACVSMLLVPLVYRLARRWGGTPTAACLAAIGVSLYPYYVYTPSTLYPATLVTLLLVWGWLLASGPWTCRRASAAGVLWGVTVLAVPYTCFCAIATLVVARRQSPHLPFRAAGIFVAAMCVPIAPWLIRNWSLYHAPVMTTNDGYVMWKGNNLQRSYFVNDANVPDDQLQRELDKTTNEHQASQVFLRRAWMDMRADWRRVMCLWLAKACVFWAPLSRTLTDQGSRAWLYPVVSCVAYLPLLLAGGYYVIRHLRQRQWAMAGACFGAFTIVCMVTISATRFRLPLDVLLIVAAALQFDAFLRRPRKSQDACLES